MIAVYERSSASSGLRMTTPAKPDHKLRDSSRSVFKHQTASKGQVLPLSASGEGAGGRGHP